MNRHTLLLIGSILTLDLSLSRSAAAQPALLPVYVTLRNQMGLSADVMAGARAEVSRVYKTIAVELIWTGAAPAAGDRYLSVSIVSEGMASWLKAPQSALGTAFVGDGHAYVMFERVERLARTSRTWGHGIAITLGITIAHEIGHLLLNSTAHGATGLMTAVWGGTASQMAASGKLLFTPREADLIRVGLAGRR